jgi:MraZ protein
VDMRSPETSFLGSHVNKLDAKGRIAVPADFRRALEGEHGRGFYCLMGVKDGRLECGGGDFITTYNRYIAALPPLSDERELLEDHILGSVRFLPFDTEGRVVIPDPYREFAKLKERVCFKGRGNDFIIVDADADAKRMAETRPDAQKAIIELRTRLGGAR